jgi:hypothetical protein
MSVEKTKYTLLRTVNSGNACYHSAQNLLPSHLLSKYVKMRIYDTVMDGGVV